MKGIFDDHVFHQAKFRSRRIPRNPRPGGHSQIPERKTAQDARAGCRQGREYPAAIAARRVHTDRKTGIGNQGLRSRRITFSVGDRIFTAVSGLCEFQYRSVRPGQMNDPARFMSCLPMRGQYPYGTPTGSSMTDRRSGYRDVIARRSFSTPSRA